MLLKKTRLGPSKISGMGLFADEFIPKGTVVWRFVENLDFRIDANALSALPETMQAPILKYGYLSHWSNKFVLCLDDARFCNHSEDPNIGEVYDSGEEENVDVALRDIHPGEEITCNYKVFDKGLSGCGSFLKDEK
jgi:SET domain-containing protein